MYNDELFSKLASEFPPEAMKKFCLMTSRMYDLMYINFQKSEHKDACDPREEYDYQRQWWYDRYCEIVKSNSYERNRT